MTNLQPHEFCLLPDRMDPTEIAKLESSMREQGYYEEEPIIKFEGKILDGWHRQIAADRVGVEPTYREFQGTRDEALEYSYFRMFARRHTAKGRLAAIALLYDRMRVKRGEPAMTHEQLHEVTGVSKPYISQASSIEKRRPGSLDAIAKGELSLSQMHRDLMKSEPERAENEADPMADIWTTRDKWKMVVARLTEIGERDIDPLFSRRGSEVIVESLANKVRENGKTRLGKTFTQETIDKINMNLPHKVCDECNGNNGHGCEVCHFRGWWTAAEAKARRK